MTNDQSSQLRAGHDLDRGGDGIESGPAAPGQLASPTTGRAHARRAEDRVRLGPPVIWPRRIGGTVSITGDYYPLDGGSAGPFASLLERDAMLVLDTDHTVSRWFAQPERFFWRQTGGGHRSYTPDLLKVSSDGALTYLQVKPLKRLRRDPDLAGRLPCIEDLCRSRNATHEIWTEHQVRREPRLGNASLVYSSASLYDAAAAERVLALVSSTSDVLSLGDLCRIAGGLRAGLALVARRLVTIDLDDALVAETPVYKGPAA